MHGSRVPLAALALITLAGVGATVPLTAGPQSQRPTVLTLTPLAENDPVQPGTTVKLAVQVKVAEGLHVTANKPRDPSAIPARLTLETPPGVTFTEVVFPPSVEFRIEGLDQPNDVWAGDFTIGATVTIDKTYPPGTLTIPAHLRYQACTEKACLLPDTIDTGWTLRIVPAGGPVTKMHSDIFRPIAFGHGDAPPAARPASAPSAPGPTASADDAVTLFDRDFTIAAKTTGYMGSAEFTKFIHNTEAGVVEKGLFEDRGPLAILGLVFLGGLALNLTPCVLPMIPINLAIIGAGTQAKRRSRGFWLGGTYGGAMAIAYGLLGLVVILTAGTFGTINASPWFNAGIAALFVFLGLAMFDVVSLDFSRLSSKIQFRQESRGTFLLAFGMGAVAAVLAGACVAPVVVQVVVFASNMYATGTPAALALPFVLGLGMAIPWPFVGAGMASLPKPGAWMNRVKYAFGVFILATAAYYGYVAYGIVANRWVDPETVRAGVEEQLLAGWQPSLAEGLRTAKRDGTPVLIDMWATWCKDCLTMDKTTLKDPAVLAALSRYTRIKFEATDPDQPLVKTILQRVNTSGLPTYVILHPRTTTGTAAR